MHYPVCSIGNVSVIKKVISDFYSARQCTSSHYEFCSFDLGKTRSYWEKSLQTIDNSDNFPGGRIFKIFSQQYCHKFRFEMSNILNILTSTTSVARLSLPIAILLSRSDICVILVVLTHIGRRCIDSVHHHKARCLC